MSTRPPMLVAVVGTRTDVGKTWLTAKLVMELRRRGVQALARKPVQSFDPNTDATDADVLAEANGESAAEVCPRSRWYALPMAPPMAAEALASPAPLLGELVQELSWPGFGVEVGLVEGVGGVRSPLADDGDNCDLIAALRPAVTILVADAGLGTIDAVRLSMGALAQNRPSAVQVVFLNHFDSAQDLHQRNLGWLIGRDNFVVETDPDSLATRLQDL